MVDQAEELGCKVGGGVGELDVLAVEKGQTLGSDGGRNNRDAHGHSFVDFDAGAATGEEWDGDEGTTVDVGLDVGNGAGDFDGRVGKGEVADGGWGIPADDFQADGGEGLADEGEDFAEEPVDAFDVGHPVHGTQEADGRDGRRMSCWLEGGDVDTCRDVAEDVGEVVLIPAKGGVVRGDGDHAVEEGGEVFFSALHAVVLAAEVGAFEGIFGGVGEAFPDLGFDVVLEEHDGLVESEPCKLRSRGQEIANHKIRRLRGHCDALTPGCGTIAIKDVGMFGKDEVCGEGDEEKGREAWRFAGRDPFLGVGVRIGHLLRGDLQSLRFKAKKMDGMTGALDFPQHA